MNAYQEMPLEERRDEVKTLLDNMKLIVYKDIHKRPSLEPNELSKKVEFIKKSICNWEYLVVVNNLDEFLQNEFLKVIYDTIKQELITNIYESELLEYIIDRGFKLEIFKNMIKEDITEINSSSFINIELLNYLNRTIEMKGILSKHVIKGIIMCNDYDKIREGNSKYLDNQNKTVNHDLSNIKRRIKNEISHIKDNIRKLRKKLTKQLIVRTVVPTIFALVILAGGVYTKFTTDKIIRESPTAETFNTTYTTYSSITNERILEETKYIEPLEENKIIMTIYDEPFLMDGRLYRVVKEYEINEFNENNLEEYLSMI